MNPIGRSLVRWIRFWNNLKILCRPICQSNWNKRYKLVWLWRQVISESGFAHTRYMTCKYVRHNWYICARHESFICATWLVWPGRQLFCGFAHTRVMTCTYVGHNPYICGTQLNTYARDMTRSYVRHDSYDLEDNFTKTWNLLWVCRSLQVGSNLPPLFHPPAPTHPQFLDCVQTIRNLKFVGPNNLCWSRSHVHAYTHINLCIYI